MSRNIRRTKVGIVIGISGMKSVSVLVEQQRPHELFSKVVKTSKKYLVHSEVDDLNKGDKVEIMECRPISKRKNWRVVSVLEKNKKRELVEVSL